jgi:hypothetical protein
LLIVQQSKRAPLAVGKEGADMRKGPSAVSSSTLVWPVFIAVKRRVDRQAGHLD